MEQVEGTLRIIEFGELKVAEQKKHIQGKKCHITSESIEQFLRAKKAARSAQIKKAFKKLTR